MKKTKKSLRAGVSTKVRMRLTKSARRILRQTNKKQRIMNARLSLRIVDSQGRRTKKKAIFRVVG